MKTTILALCGLLATGAAQGRAVAAEAPALTLGGVEPGVTIAQTYRCEGGEAFKLPATAFEVTYYNSDSNNLVVLPVAGEKRVLVNVAAASGARYVAGELVWWEKGGTVQVTSGNGERSVTCRQIRPG